MATDAPGRTASELRRRSQGMAFATPRSAAILRGLAEAAQNDASPSALLDQGWLDRPVQQHLPGRAGLLLSGLAMLAQPWVRVLEPGACAGLTLQLDEYSWQGPDWTWGASDSPVRFRIDSPAPPPGLAIVERSGCDIAPVDARDPAMVRRLHAFVPPELSQVHQDLDAALGIAAGQPPRVDKAHAQEWPALGVHTVVRRTGDAHRGVVPVSLFGEG